MNDARPETTQPDVGELADMMQALSSISTDLMRSYETLAGRAARVEDELCRTNAELERRLGELDTMHRDLETILQALPVGVAVSDERGRVVRVNDSLLQLLGCEAEDVIGQERPRALRGMATNGEPVEYRLPDGSRRMLSSRYSAFENAAGNQLGSVEILDDRTEVLRLGERIHNLDKMAALGTMAAGIAHEIRNPMNAIQGFADLLQRRITDDERARRWAGLISEGVGEVDLIIRSMLSFSEPGKMCVETLEARELLQAAIDLATNRTREGQEPSAWELTSDCRVESLTGDRIKLRQALRNLISNAMDVQPGGGRIHVCIERRSDEIVLSVADSGPGIAPELVGKLADPFFTTRADGTGLGLSLVDTIARLHGGGLELDPAPSFLGGALIAFKVPHTPLD